MSEAQAQQFMDQFKQTDVPFDYPPDCCYARARVMSDMMEKEGYASRKLWYEGYLEPNRADGTRVAFPDANGNSAPVTWHYHVAPIVQVEQSNGKVEERVLDPSLSDKPLSMDEWKARCGPHAQVPTMQEITPSNVHYPFDPDTKGRDYPVAYAEQALSAHRTARDDARQAANKKATGK
ncbi:MAG: hypothetical protein KF778_06210 [Rhodocyclaceae bacterium]|nr:hypothetical protein [Rhodocyclaceae bacterium]MBX3667980.1 hypothetical protein [Rhodocyclaceae bacterium]